VRESAYNRHVASVTKSGVPATAQVISAGVAYSFWRSHETHGSVDYAVEWNMVFKVAPADQPPFDLSVKMQIPVLISPIPGMALQVVYDPKNHENIVIDPASVATNKRDGVVQETIMLAQAMGGDTTGMEEAAAGISDPIAAAEAASAQMRANVMARSNEMMRQSLAARRGDAAAGPAQPAESVDQFQAQIEKLNGLKEAGVLSDEEYAAARQQLIDKL
jgi:hypothetical protein